MSDQNNQSDEFYKLEQDLSIMRTDLYTLKHLVKTKEKEVKNTIQKLQNSCNHKYKRECTTTGCYAEYEYICGYCRKYK